MRSMYYSHADLSPFSLFVDGRIERHDAVRQERTATAILQRFDRQPGVILADEVGMGKTFVAMTVACAVALKEKKPVVIMIPPSLLHKWPADFRLFRQYCIQDEDLKQTLKHAVAEKPEEFLKHLDNDESDMPQIIFLTYGALSRSLTDSWVKLAILQRVLRGRHDTDALYRSLSRFTGALIEKQSLEAKNIQVGLWETLLNRPPSEWKKVLVKHDIFDASDDDPVPASFLAELKNMKSSELDSLYHTLVDNLPKKDTVRLKERLDEVRDALRTEAKKIWKTCLKKIQLDLPLLVFDEAHHLKNAQTQLVRGLFQPIAEEDAGMLANQFDRMLFLTATPFQLGHHELLSVLQRFNSIKWNSAHPPALSRDQYTEELNILERALDDSQLAARRLDRSWSNLTTEDISINDGQTTNVYEWWQHIQATKTDLSPAVNKVIEDYATAKKHLLQVQPMIRHFVIRHLKPRFLRGDKIVFRRDLLPGDEIINTNSKGEKAGLQITNDALLPFLLAARLTTLRQDERPVFAEGLASSYEAFRFTREQRLKAAQKKLNNASTSPLTDTDDDPEEDPQQVQDSRSVWYLDQLDKSLRDVNDYSAHPKMRPTVEKAIELWSKGEKVLIFCHYVETGKALRKYISAAMRQFIRARGAQKYNCPQEEVDAKLESLGEPFKNKNSAIYQLSANNIKQFVDDYPELIEYTEDIIAAVMRFLSSPSFLVRFAAVGEGMDENDYVHESFHYKDQSGFTLRQLIENFLKFLNNRVEDREQYLQYLKTARTEVIGSSLQMEDAEEQQASVDHIIASVRLCYGQTPPHIRQKLMKTFNTPFFPDILITSSVMGEGVDLHLNCRHIIHHDLCWNPSTLEQRTGRVDRIGAKAEKALLPIQVYLPYVSETQDEKMYRVVMERERWFNIIMGEKYKVDAINTDKYAQRIPLPEELAKELSFDLTVK